MSKPTQNETVARALSRGESLTALQALKQYGIGRLAARIDELRRAGLDVRTRMIAVTKSDGSNARVAEYYLAPAALRRANRTVKNQGRAAAGTGAGSSRVAGPGSPPRKSGLGAVEV